MKSLTLLLLLSFFQAAFADNVRITNPLQLAVNGSTGGGLFSLFVEKPVGEATAEASPAKVYVPLHNSTDPDHDKYYYQYSPITLDTLFKTTVSGHVLQFPLTVSPLGTRYLYAAAKGTGTEYKIIKKYTSALTSIQDVLFPVGPYDFCLQFASECTNLAPTSTYASGKFKIYFFLSTEALSPLGLPVVPATSTGGVFFEASMSNRIFTRSEIFVSAFNVRKGDKRIIFDYSVSSTMLEFRKVLVFKHTTDSPLFANEPIGTYFGAGSILERDFPATQQGIITINDLPNDVKVTASVALMDLYGFATTLSNHVSETPIEIQELLKKQTCYLLTAGFGEEHFVVNFFRSYRDQILSNSWLGKKFIKVYYRSAPHYALIIYKSEAMRFVIRTAAYALYFFFNYWWLILFIPPSCYYLNLRKNKILMPNNGL